ncbi:hypothetical protein LEMLEM_LOCUS2778, partial [Lemmus lemmus]
MSSLGGAITIIFLLQASRGAQVPPVPRPPVWPAAAVVLTSCGPLQLCSSSTVALSSCGPLQLWSSPAVALSSCGPLQLCSSSTVALSSCDPLQVIQSPAGGPAFAAFSCLYPLGVVTSSGYP